MNTIYKLKKNTEKLQSLFEEQTKVLGDMIYSLPPPSPPPSPTSSPSNDYQIVNKDDYSYINGLHDDIPELYYDDDIPELYYDDDKPELYYDDDEYHRQFYNNPKNNSFRRMNANSIEEDYIQLNALKIGDRVRMIKLPEKNPKSVYHRGIVQKINKDRDVLLKTESFGEFWIPETDLVQEFDDPKRLNLMDYVDIPDKMKRQLGIDKLLIGQIVPPTRYSDMLSKERWNVVWVDIGLQTIPIHKGYLSKIEDSDKIEKYIKDKKEVLGWYDNKLVRLQIVRRHYDGSLDVIFLQNKKKKYYYPRTSLYIYLS